ncbi:MAG: hypothetical protein KC492_03475, partial [Myxococcales bacterium]|nr:hypothetical protein [Myxococcales bacterium]
EESCACQKCQRKALREVAKCVHPDTLVNLDGSYTTLGAYVGAMPAGAQGRVQYDSIADGRGSWTGVEAYYRPGAKACVHVTTQRGVLTCAEDHPLATATGGTVLAKDALGVELASCEVAALPYVGPMPQVVVPGGAFRSLPTMHIHTNHTWAYFAGMFLGDGTVTGTTMAICHGDVRTEDAAHGTSYLAWQDQIVAVLEALGFVATRRNTMVTFGDRQAGRCLAALGLTTHDMRVGTAAAPPKGQRRLRVPPWVLAMGREGVEHFLAGLADTDGSVGSSGALRITTKDPVFAGQLATLFQALGESRVRMEPMWNKTYERYYWRLGPTVAFGHRVLFDKMRHPKRLRLRAGSLTPRTKTTNKCTAVVPAGELECVDIQVSADDHMYQQNNFIASNTVIYAVNYGSGAETVHENIYNKGYEGPPITVAMVQDVMVAIFSEFPGLVRYREETLRQARETGELRSPLLFRHRIFPLGDIEATVAYN